MLRVAMIEPEKNSISVQYEVIIADNVEKDIISNFSCGKEYFDSYFRNHEKELTKTYIWRNTTNNEVVAFASIACSGLVVKAGNGNIRVYPAVYIECFAVDKKYQDLKWREDGEEVLLSADILSYLMHIIIRNISDKICYADCIILDAVPEAEKFYARQGFRIYDETFIANKTIRSQDCLPMYYIL